MSYISTSGLMPSSIMRAASLRICLGGLRNSASAKDIVHGFSVAIAGLASTIRMRSS